MVLFALAASCLLASLASAMCGWGLEIGRYVEGAATQPDSAIVAIRVLFALIPAIFLIICITFLLKYPITKEAHAEVLAKLQERRKENH